MPITPSVFMKTYVAHDDDCECRVCVRERRLRELAPGTPEEDKVKRDKERKKLWAIKHSKKIGSGGQLSAALFFGGSSKKTKKKPAKKNNNYKKK